MGRPTCITVHHEGDMAQLASTGEVRLHLMKMQAVHMKPKGEDGLGAADIAYHFLIDPSGRVIEGRKLAWQGAHAGNNDANRGNIGICLLGNFDVQRPTEAQKQALRKLLVTLMNRYNIPVSRVYTHCEVKRKFALAATDCPGKNLQVYVDGLRSSLRYASR
jgi:N-acetyl-anhydromuramyl-L-alanine amidase AmpD